MYKHIYIYIYTHVYIYIYTHIYIYIHIHTCIYIYIYAYIHIHYIDYIHIYIYTHIHIIHYKDHEIIQCSMDLLYVMDHADVACEIVQETALRGELWDGWIQILLAMQSMNPHTRKSGAHVEYTNAAWGNALTLHTDLMSTTWLILDAAEFKADM